MSVKKIEVETVFGRCRCCLAYGYLKNMWIEHQFDGEAEVYGEMLVQCFALTWDHSEDSMEQDQICEQCIFRLRDASDFKKVVLSSQDELLQELESENLIAIKEERLEEEFLEDCKPESEADTADNTYYDPEFIMDNGDTGDSDKDEEYEEIEYLEDEDTAPDALDTDSSQQTDQSKQVRIRRKPTRHSDPDDDDAPKRKWPKKLPKSERQKTYKQYSEVDLRKCLEEVRKNILTPAEAAEKYDIPKKTICAKVKAKPSDDQWIKNKLDGAGNKRIVSKERTEARLKARHALEVDDETDITDPQRNKTVLANFKETVRTILRCTNATPVRGHWGIGYACIYCKYQSPDTSELKNHTLTTHSEDVSELDHVKYIPEMVIKLDITDLKCKICDRHSDTLEEIMNHIKYIHKQPLCLESSSHIVPFKFATENLKCALCEKQFNYFKQLYEHMNEHFQNYKCHGCDRYFINQRSLRTHAIRHQTGTFVCSFCSKIFDTRIKMKEHERVLHLRGSKTRKCGYCDEMFMDVVKKNEHEVKEHGAAVQKFECKACEKNFESQRCLNNHMNHFHLQLRPHKCPECEKGFYNKNELKRHRVKHTKIKEFQCSICSKFYSSKGSLKSHMKIHDSDKCFTCERCGETFIQKNVWVNHMTNHAESLAALELEQQEKNIDIKKY